jgi:NAD+ dependent glucose-6-phosphate dehydrogenase
MTRKRVLITGAYGLIGNVVYRRLAQDPGAYDVYGLGRRRHASARLEQERLYPIPDDHFVLADLADQGALRRATQGMDAVVHLAADPSEDAGWESILASNITGAYHVLEACRLAGVGRVIVASSIQVIRGYGLDEPYRSLFEGRAVAGRIPLITGQHPPRPLNLYASSKVWAEALAHTYAYAHGLSCLCLRIGWVVADDRPRRNHDWCSQRDVAQIVQRCVDAPPSLRFDVFYAVSDNRDRWMDVEHARQVLGYVPQDRAEDAVPAQERAG